MTTIEELSAEIARRAPAFAQDGVINSAEVIATLIRQHLASHARCIYCNSVFMLGTEELHNALADHITSCEKSPLVQSLKEGQAIVEEAMNALQDPAEVWAMMLRGEIARPQALDHYEECKAELEQVQNALDNYWRTNPTTLAATEAVMKEVNHFRIELHKLREKHDAITEMCSRFLVAHRDTAKPWIESFAEVGAITADFNYHPRYPFIEPVSALTPSNPLDKKEGQ